MTNSDCPTTRPKKTTADKVVRLGGAVILVASLATFAVSRDSRGDASATLRAQEVQSCRSQFAAAIDDVTTDIQTIILDGLAAIGPGGSRDEYAAAVAKADRAKRDLRTATDAYVDAADRAVQDPDGFLAECRESAG